MGPMPSAATLSRAGWFLGLATVWFTMKVASVWAWVQQPDAWGDTWYYFQSAERALAGAGLGGVLREYPTPAAALLVSPYALGAHDIERYREAIIVMTSVVDGAFALLLARLAGPLAVGAWIVLTTLLGQLPLLRFDVLPAVAAGAAVLLLARGRPATASVLTALGTGLKVWPVLLAPLSVADARNRLRPLLAFVASGAALVALSLPAGGIDRLFSPLDYQRDRGLQIESVAATWPMVRWAAGDPGLRVWYGPYYAYEVDGPLADTWIRVSDAAGLVALVGCLVLLVVWFRAGRPAAAVPYLALSLIAAFVVTSRALSPQYLLWLAAPVAALVGLGLLTVDRWQQVSAVVTFVAVAGLCLLTTGIYPVHYAGVTVASDDTPRAVLLLVARNIGLVTFGLWAVANAVILSGRARRYSEPGPITPQ